MDQQNLKGEWGQAITIGGREEQQDSVEILSSNQSTLLIVADGMGGHQGGRKASSLLTETAAEIFRNTARIDDTEHFFNTIIQTAYQRIREYANQTGSNPHATVVMLLLQNQQAFWAHIGDSRLIRFKRGQFHERTRDHSVVELLVHDGEIDESEMADHPDQNKLLRSIGGEAAPKASFGKAGLEAGDAFLLCSDGLWETVSNQEMAQHIYNKSPQEAADFLVGTAQDRGGKTGDNVSCALWKSSAAYQAVAAVPAANSNQRTPTGERREQLDVNRYEKSPGNPWKPIALLLFGIIIGFIIVYYGSNIKQTFNSIFAPAPTDSSVVVSDSSQQSNPASPAFSDSTSRDSTLQQPGAPMDSSLREENNQPDVQSPGAAPSQPKKIPGGDPESTGNDIERKGNEQ